MSQGAINIDHSRSPSSGETSTLSWLLPRKGKEATGKMRADFRNFPRYNRNSARRVFAPAESASFARANCVFSFRCSIQLKSLEYNSLRFNVGRGEESGQTQIAYLHRERCNTHALEAIFSLPTRGYNVFLGTLINSIHFAQRFLITHCTEP